MLEKEASQDYATRPSLSSSSTLNSFHKQSDHDDKNDIEAQIKGVESQTTTTRTRQLQATLSRTLSKVRTADDLELGPPPDGGFQAWLLVGLTYMVIFNTWGFINSFGLFQTYYVEQAKIGTASDVAWIGSGCVFILFGIGTFTGRALDAGYFRLIFAFGSMVYLFGMLMLSFCKTYWQVFLAQTVCIGIGFGCVFVPSMALLSTYFLKKRAIALGIAVCGSSNGGLVFPAIAQKLLPTVGFAWTIRTIALMELVIAIICGLLMKPRLSPRKSGPLVEWSSFKEAPYTLYLCGSFFFFWSVFIGYFFVGTYSVNIIGMSRASSITLLMIMNGVGMVGRFVPAWLAHHFGPLNLMIPFVLFTGIIGYTWLAVKDAAGLWVFAVIYGLFAAGIQSLFPVALTSLTLDPKKLGVRTGMGFGVVGFAVFTGPPIAGALIENQGGRFLGVQVYAGTCMIISTIFMIAARRASVGWCVKKV